MKIEIDIHKIITGVVVVAIVGFGTMVNKRGERITNLETNEKLHYQECKADVNMVSQKLQEHLEDYNRDKEQAK